MAVQAQMNCCVLESELYAVERVAAEGRGKPAQVISITSKLYDRVRVVRQNRLLVIADGPRTARPEERALCETTRKVVSSPDWPCELLTNFQEENSGEPLCGCIECISAKKPWCSGTFRRVFRNAWHGRDALPRDPRQHVR